MSLTCSQPQSQKAVRLTKLREFLKLLADVNRLRILCFLSQKEHCVCEMVETLQLPQNLVSHHLAKLKKLSLVAERKDGSFVYYSVHDKAMREHLALFNSIIKTHEH